MILSFKQFVAEEISNIPKWWYNTKKRHAVKVFRDFHIQQVFASPNEFGFTPEDLERLAPKDFKLRDRIEKLAKPLRKAGWTEVTWLKRPDTVLIRAENNGMAQKTLDWFLKKVNATPKQATIQRPEGSDMLKSDAQITAFAKTGKIIRQTEIGATMARFR